jgi:hypothetical protein
VPVPCHFCSVTDFNCCRWQVGAVAVGVGDVVDVACEVVSGVVVGGDVVVVIVVVIVVGDVVAGGDDTLLLTERAVTDAQKPATSATAIRNGRRRLARKCRFRMRMHVTVVGNNAVRFHFELTSPQIDPSPSDHRGQIIVVRSSWSDHRRRIIGVWHRHQLEVFRQ